ncbi:MAG: redoxin domain-containing protein [Chitinophagaceae bacterium]
MKKILFSCVIVFIVFAGKSRAQESVGGLKFERNLSDEEIENRRKRVESNPTDSSMNQAYINAMVGARRNEEMALQYEAWIKKYPKAKKLPFIIGVVLTHLESPKAKQFLLKAAELDPDNAVIYASLSQDAGRWGDKKAAREYMKKAMEKDPMNASYAWDYAWNTPTPDGTKDIKAIRATAEKFINNPDKDRVSNMFYWLGLLSKDPSEKVFAFRTVSEKFPTAMYGAMSINAYFQFLLEYSPAKALDYAVEMEKKGAGQWTANKERAQRALAINQLIADEKYGEAITEVEKGSGSGAGPARLGGGDKQAILIADLLHRSGNVQAAYDKIMGVFGNRPTAVMMNLLLKYGKQIGRDEKVVKAEIYKIMDAKAKPATDFSLKNYLTGKNTSLSDFRGKVVFVTYWFPGCGPCRGEFPHLEYVLKDFKGKPLNYFGINVARDQNEYVIPFVRRSGVSFTPLEDVKDRQKGTLDNRNAAPSNFIIGKDGLLYFSGFKIDENSREDFRLMLDLVMNKV